MQNSLFFLCLTDQVLQYLLAPVVLASPQITCDQAIFFFFLAKKKKNRLIAGYPADVHLGFVCHKRQTNPKGRLRGGYSCIAFHRPFCWLFLCLFSLHLGLFFASLCHKFNLSRDDCILLLNLNCHMVPVYNFHAEA